MIVDDIFTRHLHKSIVSKPLLIFKITKKRVSDSDLEREFRREYRRELEARVRDEDNLSKSIDNKATTMITIAATATTLLVGFAGSLIAPKVTDLELIFADVWLPVASAFVLIGLILAIVSILVFLYSSNPKKYLLFPSPHMIIKYDNLNLENVKKFRLFKGMSFEDFDDKLSIEYINMLTHNREVNQERMKLIFKGQLLFAADVCLILSAIMINFFVTLRIGFALY